MYIHRDTCKCIVLETRERWYRRALIHGNTGYPLHTPTFNFTLVPGICAAHHRTRYVSTSNALGAFVLTSHPEVTVYNAGSLRKHLELLTQISPQLYPTAGLQGITLRQPFRGQAVGVAGHIDQSAGSWCPHSKSQQHHQTHWARLQPRN